MLGSNAITLMPAKYFTATLFPTFNTLYVVCGACVSVLTPTET